MQITTLHQLFLARQKRKAVICMAPCFKGPIPAAFMMNLPGELLHRLMAEGMWVYRK